MPDETTNPDAPWPPRPQRAADSLTQWSGASDEPAICQAPFECLHVRAKGSVSDFRVGVASLYRGGLTISGKRAQGAQVQFWILLALFATVPFVRPAYLWLLGWFLAALGLECWRKQDTIALGWADIEEVHFTQHYRLLCIVYRQTDPKGRIRRYSITPKFSPSDFDAFSAAIYKNASPNVTILPKGKLTLFCGSAAAYAFLAGIVALAIVSWCGRFSLDSITPR